MKRWCRTKKSKKSRNRIFAEPIIKMGSLSHIMTHIAHTQYNHTQSSHTQYNLTQSSHTQFSYTQKSIQKRAIYVPNQIFAPDRIVDKLSTRLVSAQVAGPASLPLKDGPRYSCEDNTHTHQHCHYIKHTFNF